MSALGYGRQQNEICRAATDLQRTFSATPTLFRPPYGLFNNATRRAVHACHLAGLVQWTATMSNGQLQVQGGHLAAGDIVLFHFRPTLYDDLRQLLSTIASDGLTVGRLESYLEPGKAR